MNFLIKTTLVSLALWAVLSFLGLSLDFWPLVGIAAVTTAIFNLFTARAE